VKLCNSLKDCNIASIEQTFFKEVACTVVCLVSLLCIVIAVIKAQIHLQSRNAHVVINMCQVLKCGFEFDAYVAARLAICAHIIGRELRDDHIETLKLEEVACT
jgi:hypothetical protein